MKILIKEMSRDGSYNLVYLMTNDNIPAKCEISSLDKLEETINKLTKNKSLPRTTIKNYE